MAPSRRPKGGTTRYRRNWDTFGLGVLWSRTSKTVSHEGRDLELCALVNGKPLKGVSYERRDMGELCDAPYETGSSTENIFKHRDICSRMTIAYVCNYAYM